MVGIVEGGYYRNRSGAFVRKVVRIFGDDIHWADDVNVGRCTRNAFSKWAVEAVQPSEELKAKIEAVLRYWGIGQKETKMEATVTTTRTLSIPDDKVAEARRDLEKLLVPGGGNICYNDGYFANSLVKKWGMSTSDLEKLVGRPVMRVVWVDKDGQEI